MKKSTLKLMLLILTMSAIVSSTDAQLGKLKDLKNKVASKVGGGDRDAFPSVWTSKTSSKANIYSCTSPNGNYALTTSKTDMSLIDGASGDELWYAKFKEATGEVITNSNYQYVLWEANTLLLFDSKAGKNDRIAGINLADGSLMWTLDGYQIPKKTIEDAIAYIPEMKAFAFSLPAKTVMIDVKEGEVIWETEEFRGAIGRHIYLEEEGQIVMINFMRGAFDAFAAGIENINAIAKLDIRTGDVIWKTSHQGFGGKKYITKERQGDLKIEGDRIFVIYNGIQVFDFNTGENVWSAYYNQDIKILKKPAGMASGLEGGAGRKLSGATYDAIADPLITDDAVYVVLQEKDKKVRRKYLQKFDLATGELLWTSEKINDAKALPRLALVDGVLVAQIGGLVNQQYSAMLKDPVSKGTYWAHVNEWVWVGKFGLRGFNADNGTEKWNSDKFKGAITKMATDGANVFAASNKYFYSIKAKNGVENYQVDFKATKVGKPKFSYDIGEAVTIMGTKGVTAFQKSNGETLYSSEKIKKIERTYERGGKLYVQNEKDDLTLLDLQTGATLGTVKIPKHNSEKKTLAQAAVGGQGNDEQYARIRELSGGADLTEDGKYIFVFDGTKIIKYQAE
ncbi:PQQ-binding-like beta-propeller repeat protein [Ekhidna sp.]|uniref:outer membrane protein assembly factor BamB family protein n=1 Tax=Ekhidna sp. TaxID=2608089 RepID=UPI003BAC9095